MGSVSSLVNGNSLNSKHCKASEHRSKKGISPPRASGGCSLDELLKCGFTQGSSSTAQPSGGLSYSRSGRSEDFFYIKVSHKPRPVHQRGASMEDQSSGKNRERESDGRLQPKLLLMSRKMTHRTSAEKSSVRSTAFKPVISKSASSTETGHNNPDILCPLEKAKSPYSRHKHDASSGTLSDSGRNSMSSLPTHSTSGSLSASTGPVSHSDGSSASANSLSKGAQPNLAPRVNGNGINPDCSYGAALNGGGSASKANGDAGSPLPSEEPGALSETAGGIRSPITTDESLIELLEQRLLERETELQELQVGFEDKEADTCQRFEDRQRYCAEDMEALKQRCSTRLQQASLMAAETQEALQLQVSQLQAEKERLQEDVSTLTQEKRLLELRLKSCAAASEQLAPTLEETQWEVCQKTGEISLWKQQLRDCQADVQHKLNEIVCLRASLKDNKAKMETLERQNEDRDDKLRCRTIEVEVCQNELQRKKNEAAFLREKVGKLEEDIRGMKEDIAVEKERRLEPSLQLEARVQSPASETPPPGADPGEEGRGPLATASLHREVERLKQQLGQEKDSQERLASGFEQERLTWNKEKDRVIKYQKQLQINYLQVHKKNQELERSLKELSAELEGRAELGLERNYSSGLQTYEDVIATEI
ncbi:Leucine zipper putative tumor suppressor 1 [Liparis tanakae]|uniref:Leucine zipper putative tumor suppressor 1 n=1 Tax=Liparis tanakae TaxID=230148 RepID=A0A4Z2GC94_9TELE|nr:Leucine zipper putative tumor suppressor 1 [Liparis tanakae]